MLSVATTLTIHEIIALCREHAGFPPKTLSRLLRFQNLVKTIDRGQSWGDPAYEHAYSDQAHMNRKFCHFADITPTAYHMRSPEVRNHMIADNL